MNRREKLLLYGFLGIIALWQGQPVFHSLFIAPLDERAQRVEALQTAISENKVRERQLERAVAKLKDWSLRSLPPDPLIASSVYQNWLIELATRVKFKNVTVTAGRVDTRPKGDTYFAVQATVKGQGTLNELCDFLYEFRNSGLLHRVARMAVDAPRHEANPLLDVTLYVEALSLVNSPARTALIADPAHPPASDDRLQERTAYASGTANNVFVRGYTGPRSPPSTAPFPVRVTSTPPPPLDTGSSVALVAALSDQNGVADAWLYDRRTNVRTVLTVGASFQVGGITGRVVSIDADSVTLFSDGSEWRLELGENLSQMRKIVAPAAAPAVPLIEPRSGDSR